MSQAAGTPVGAASIAELRTPRHDAPAARDNQVIPMLAVADKLTARRGAGVLIAPPHVRLAEMRSKRPLNLFRLLCTPLDPLIVPGHAWRRGSPGIPRSALGPLGRVVHGILGDTAAGFDAAIAGHTSDEQDVVAEVGARLWPRAAEILATVAMPVDWTIATDLKAGDHATLVPAIAALLAQAVSLRRLAARACSGVEPETDELRTMLEAVVPAGPVALAMMVLLLMASLPHSERLIRLADHLASRQDGPAGRAVVDGAIEFVLDKLEDAPSPGPNVAQATQHIRRAAIMLNDLSSRAAHRPVWRARIERVRRKVDSACRERFAIELDAQLLSPAAWLAGGSELEIATLEATARALRRFETTARQIGSAEHYDMLLRRAAEVLRPTATEDASERIDRIRLMEILRGPDAALALLKAADA